MKQKLRVLYLSSEVAPFAKTGGLADVASALPKALHDQGLDIRVIMPKYGSISERKFVLREVIRLKQIPVALNGKEHITGAKSAFIPDSKVQVYFLEYKPFFGHADLYVDSKTDKDFSNNAERFMLFCRSVIETIKLLHWQPQIIHCNDWQTAMVPWLIKNEYADDPFFENTKTLLSIHNMAFQGAFPKEEAAKIDVPAENADAFIYDKVNFLKAGIMTADFTSTVSENYAKEIQSEECGAGLQDVLKERKGYLKGILNGVDYGVWNPETDSYIAQQYTSSDMTAKLDNKKQLLEDVGLPFYEERPVIGIVSRLTDQKGFDLIAEVIDKIISLNAQIVILGVGDQKYHEFFEKVEKKHPKNISINLTFDEELAHKIEAGSDIFLMPSQYEPCGLNQMYSLKYGTVPVVRETGGLADTIHDFVSDQQNGNGFVFSEYDANAMLAALQNALKAFSDKSVWNEIVKRGMETDLSWKVSAEKYIELYNQILDQ